MFKTSRQIENIEEIFSTIPQKIQSAQVEAALGSNGYTDTVHLGDILYFMIENDEFSYPSFGGFYVVVKQTKKTVSLVPIGYKIFAENNTKNSSSLLPYYDSSLTDFRDPDFLKSVKRAWVLDPSGVSEEGDDVGLMFKMRENYGFKWDGRPVIFYLSSN
jgi:hypothetical protein